MPAASLSRTIVKLHGVLWLRSFRANPSSRIMQILIAFYALTGLFGTSVMLYQSIIAHHYQALSGAIAFGVFAYIVAAIMLPAGEGQIQPESLATMPITAKEAFPGLVLIQILQLRGLLALVCTTVTTVVSAMAFQQAGVGVGYLVLVILGNLLSFVIVIVLAESVVVLLNSTTTSTKKKDSKAIFSAIAFIVGLLVFMQFFNSTSNNLETQLTELGNIAQWTPLAAAGGLATFAIENNWVAATICAVITAITVGGGVFLWIKSIERRLIAPLDATTRVRRSNSANLQASSKSIVFSFLPYTPQWAVFSRTVRYIVRDSRTIIALAMVPFLTVYFIIMAGQTGRGILLVAMPILAVMTLSYSANDFGSDGPSNWIHLVSGIRTKDLVLGRHWGGAILFVLMVWVVNAGLVIYLSQRAALLVAICATGMQVATLGISVLLSVYNPFPTAKPGTNPWQDKSGFSSAAFISAFTGLLLGWIPVVPGGVLLLIGHNSDSLPMLLGGGVLAILIPGLWYLWALRRAIKQVDQHYPEIFAKVRSFV